MRFSLNHQATYLPAATFHFLPQNTTHSQLCASKCPQLFAAKQDINLRKIINARQLAFAFAFNDTALQFPQKTFVLNIEKIYEI